jgi:plastocyanin
MRHVLLGCALVPLLMTSPSMAQTRRQTATITLVNFAFTPRRLVVTQGTRVIWRSKQAGVVHDVDSDDGTSFSSPDLTNGESFRHVFKVPGRYPYHCTFHGDVGGVGMAGVVVVRAKKR